MEASAPIHAYTVPLSPGAEAAMAVVRRKATGLLRSHRGTYATALSAATPSTPPSRR